MKNKLIIECLSAAVLLSACSVSPHNQTNIKNKEITVSTTPAEMTIIPVSTQIPVMPDTMVQTIAPTSEPESELPQYIPTPTPIATSEPGLAVIITKNPTSEALNVGGKTWFIAHAENSYSLTWFMVDPLGNMYSLDNTMALMPGLRLEALEGDTLAVSNVPSELNGWGAIARFDNTAGYEMTEPAYIYVGDFLTAYSSVIEAYRSGKQLSVAAGTNPLQYGISEITNYYQSVGYALKDLDKNGIPELIVAGINPEFELSAHPIFEIFTLENGTPARICGSYPRVRFYLMRDNRLFLEGSGGAAASSLEFYQVDGSILRFLEGYSTVNDFDLMGTTTYHTSVWNGQAEEFVLYGDYNSPDYTFPTGEMFVNFNNLQNEFETQTWIPYLTKIV